MEKILSRYFDTTDRNSWPDALAQAYEVNESRIALGLALVFLDKLLLADSSVPVAGFEWTSLYDEGSRERRLDTSAHRSTMIIDAQAIEHLDILPQPQPASKVVKVDGSLFSFLSRSSKTPFGKRMLKRWTVSPLQDVTKIRERLNAVEELVGKKHLRRDLQKRLTSLPDIERILTKIYTYSVKTKVKAFWVDAQALTRLDEFYGLIETLREVNSILDEVFHEADGNAKVQAKRLKQLVTLKPLVDADAKMRSDEDEEETKGGESNGPGIYPDYEPILQEFEEMIVWKSIKGKKIPEPKKGIDENFDNVNDKISEVRSKIQSYISDVAKDTGCKSVELFESNAKFRFQLEFPDKFKGIDTDEYIFTSQVKGKKRYVTQALDDLKEELEEAEEYLKNAIVPYLRAIFRRFYEHRNIFSSAASCVAELDCLCALAEVSADDSNGVMCKPEIQERARNGKQLLEMRKLRHPCVQWIMKDDKSKRWIPNDVNIGKPSNTILITGPNMGGKSTLLRQTCLAAIMAQVGCFVAADSCKMTVVDRVFTRIGASDRILENKSTFFVELEETKAICELATPNSLVIMDELGRGTSTFDGYSIAHSVLKYLIKKVNCRTLFTTHYHMLVDEFNDMPNEVSLYKMAAVVTDDMQYEKPKGKAKTPAKVLTDKRELEFLYKFEPGVAEASFGIVVARKAGLDERVLEIASRKAEQFNDRLSTLVHRVKAKKK